LIEGVQRRTTQLVQAIGNLKYDEEIMFHSIGKRRVRSNLTEAHKIINGNYNINSDFLTLMIMV